MRKLLVTAFAVGSLVAFAASSQATTITFDDLTDNGGGTPIANGYQGLNWTNFDVLNTSLYSTPSGYQNNTVSAPNVAYNGFGSPAVISNNTFTLNSFYLGAAWNDGLQVTVTGLLNGVTLGTTTFAVSTTGPAVLETLNWTGINEIDFSSAGGVPHGYKGSGTQFVLDNLTINGVTVPAPIIGRGLPVLLAVGGFMFGAKLLRRNKPRRRLPLRNAA
jgi:hypothetical protein